VPLSRDVVNCVKVFVSNFIDAAFNRKCVGGSILSELADNSPVYNRST
jgi:hypothetical protein